MDKPTGRFPFSIDGYRGLIERLLDLGYRAVGFLEAEANAPHLILRHDLDMSLSAAVPIAETEADLGVSATYFVLMRSEMYNPFSIASRRCLGRIVELGHRIGLHFDAAPFPNDLSRLDVAAALECDLLEKAAGQAVEVVSFHRPSEGLLGNAKPIAGRPHAYQSRFFRDMGYCSDSRGAWHFGHPLDHDAVANLKPLQLLTHPIWWARPDLEGPVAKLDAFVDERSELLQAELADNCEPYRGGLESRR